MLAGQDITFVDSIFISIVGLLIVLLMLAILSVFIRILSKAVNSVASRKDTVVTAAPVPAAAAPVQAAPVADNMPDDEMIALMTAVIEESGQNPEQIVFKSIKKL